MVYPQAEAVIRRATGASRVLVFDHIYRNLAALEAEARAGVSRDNPAATPFLNGYGVRVHNDYTVRSGVTRAQQLLAPYADPELISKLLGSGARFGILNFWWPLANADACPLALCRWHSAQPQDVRTVRLHYEHRMGETYRVHHSEHHEWVYYPQMSNDEAIVFKVFDSDTTSARFALHTAFNLQPEVPGEPVVEGQCRISLELRCLVFWDELPAFADDFLAPHLRPNSPDADARLSLKRFEVLPISQEW